MAAPASGSPEEASFSAVGARGDWASSPAARHDAQRGKVVFVDFGRGKVYAVTDDGDEVLTFDGLEDVVGRLCPTVIVMDSLPSNFQNTVAEIAKAGTAFLRLRKLKILSDERKSNGVSKSHENDVKLLKTLYHRHPGLFQPLFTSLEELEVRALTELWIELTRQKKAAKRARTTIEDPVAVEAHRTLERVVNKLSKRIHEKAMGLQLYREAVKELELKGPTLAYILGHDDWALTVLPRDKLILRYQMTGRRKYRGRKIRSRLLINLANSAVLHKHHRYYKAYQRYFERFRAEGNDRKKAHWRAVLRVAERILKDLHHLAKRGTPDT